MKYRYLGLGLVLMLAVSPAMAQLFQHRTFLYTDATEVLDVVFVHCDSYNAISCDYADEKTARIGAGRYANHLSSGKPFDRFSKNTQVYAGLEVVKVFYRNHITYFSPSSCRDVNQVPNYQPGQLAFMVTTDNKVVCAPTITRDTHA